MSTTKILDNNEVMHHLHCKRGDVGRYVLLPGDPGRCRKSGRTF